MFEIILHPAIKRDMKSLPKNIVRRIRQCIADLQTNPYLPNRTEKLSGYRDVYRLKVHQSYRMAYHVDMDARQITIVSVGTRENFYDRVRRRLR